MSEMPTLVLFDTVRLLVVVVEDDDEEVLVRNQEANAAPNAKGAQQAAGPQARPRCPTRRGTSGG